MRSALTTVASRWTMTNVVRPFSRAGFFDELQPYGCEAFERAGGEIDIGALLAAIGIFEAISQLLTTLFGHDDEEKGV